MRRKEIKETRSREYASYSKMRDLESVFMYLSWVKRRIGRGHPHKDIALFE